jgi:hypothetical protein
MVISSGMAMGFSKNSGNISRLLSCFFKKSLQSSPLKVSVSSGVSTFYGILEAKERQENGLGVESSIELVYTSHAPGNQFLAVKNFRNTTCTSNFRRPNYFLLSRRG